MSKSSAPEIDEEGEISSQDDGSEEKGNDSSSSEEPLEGDEFFYAARRGDLDQIETLLGNGHHVDQRDDVSRNDISFFLTTQLGWIHSLAFRLW
jgi:hypothetical protein